MKKLSLFCDLDCVLADFVGGAARLHGCCPVKLGESWPRGTYGMEYALARYLGWDKIAPPCEACGGEGTRPKLGMMGHTCGACKGTGRQRTDAPTFAGRFWAAIDKAGADFWYGLEPLPWFDELVDLMRVYDAEFFVLTSPSHCPTSHDGKVRWMKRHFGHRFDRFAVTPHKERFAYYPGAVLIDDYEVNCRKFTHREEERDGGPGAGPYLVRVPTGAHSITFPALHNSMHHHAADPMPFVRAALSSYAASMASVG